jgi:hypothetical protein
MRIFFLFSDGGSTSRSVSTLLSKLFVCDQFVNTNPNTWNVKIRRIWWRSVCTGRFQQNLLNKFRYPYMQIVVSLILPMDVNISMGRMPDYTDFRPLQNLCSCLDIYMLENPTEISFIKWYNTWELSNLISQASHCQHHSDCHTLCTVRQFTAVVTIRAPLQKKRDKELGVTYLLNTCVHTHLTHSMNIEPCEAQHNINSLNAILAEFKKFCLRNW